MAFALGSAAVATAATPPDTNQGQGRRIISTRTANAEGGNSASQPFVVTACTAGEEHVEFMPHRNPFQGGGSGMYGDIFFAGGAGNRLQNSSTSSAVVSSSAGSTRGPSVSAPTITTPGASTPTVTSPTVTAPTTGGTTLATVPTGAGRLPPTGGGSTLPAPRAATLPQVPAAVTLGTAAPAVTPEPTSIVLIGTGLAGLLFARRRNKDGK